MNLEQPASQNTGFAEPAPNLKPKLSNKIYLVGVIIVLLILGVSGFIYRLRLANKTAVSNKQPETQATNAPVALAPVTLQTTVKEIRQIQGGTEVRTTTANPTDIFFLPNSAQIFLVSGDKQTPAQIQSLQPNTNILISARFDEAKKQWHISNLGIIDVNAQKNATGSAQQNQPMNKVNCLQGACVTTF